MKRILALMVLALVGCAGPSYELDSKWHPLKRVVERDLPFVSDTASTTMGENVYCVDLEEWLQKYPPNSPRFNALMSHEQVHSIRQHQAGVSGWIFKYLTDDDFKLAEEKLGWEKEIKLARQYGVAKSNEQYASILSSMYQGMISYEDALTWVRSIR